MQEQLSLIDLVLQASFTVQAVMLLLLLASMLSWYMIVNRPHSLTKCSASMRA